MKADKPITPVLLGGDLNAYSMAASFMRAYGVRSYVFAREKLAMVSTSSFLELYKVPNLDDCNIAVKMLTDFAKEHRGERLLLIPCADWYLEMLEYARDVLHGHFFFHIPDFEIWRATSDKASFLKILEKYGIDHPKTEIFRENDVDYDIRCKYMTPPFVVKPSDSSEYWRHSFEGMKKVYLADTLAEVRKICDKIFGAGYGGKMLVQEYISAKKSVPSSVLTTYSDKSATVTRAVLGDVLLEECAPTARGNYSAIVTKKLDGISQKLIKMLEGIGYTGIANFDIISDGKRKYCLELNARQGRSFDYLRAAGIELAALLGSEMNGGNSAPHFEYKEGVWRCVSFSTVKRFSDNEGLLKKAEMIRKRRGDVTPYDNFTEKNLKRKLYVAVHLYRQGKNYKRYKRGNADCF